MPRSQVRAHHERVDLGRVPPQHCALVRIRKNLRLHEVAGGEGLRERTRLASIVERVLVKLLGFVREVVADLRRVDIHAILARESEVLRELLESQALELATRNVVVLCENPRIDDVAAWDVIAAICDRAFCYLHARRTRAKLAAVASQLERHPMPPRASLQILEVEAKQVVPLDHIGITLLDNAHHLLEHRALVHLGALEQALETGRVGERDRDNAIALTRRRWKLKTRRYEGLDIELKAAQIGEVHPDEKSRTGEHQMLIDRIGEHEIWRVRRVGRLAGEVPQMAPGGFQSVQRIEGDENPVTEIAVEHARRV